MSFSDTIKENESLIVSSELFIVSYSDTRKEKEFLIVRSELFIVYTDCG